MKQNSNSKQNSGKQNSKRVDVTAFSMGVRERLAPFFMNRVVGAYVATMDAANVRKAAATLRNYEKAERAGFNVEKYLDAREQYAAAKKAAEDVRKAHADNVPAFAWDDIDAALWEAVRGKTSPDAVRDAVNAWEKARAGESGKCVLKGTATLATFARHAVGGFTMGGNKALARYVRGSKKAGAIVSDTPLTCKDDNGAAFLSLFYFSLCDECVARGCGVFAMKDVPEPIRAAVKAESAAAARERERREQERREQRAALVAAVDAAMMDVANARAAIVRLDAAARKAHATREKAEQAEKAHGDDVPALIRERAEKARNADIKAGEACTRARAALTTAENVAKKARERCESATGTTYEKAAERVNADRAAGRIQ